jgi:pimeloyl-ACP methyl ester carboxylesterase
MRVVMVLGALLLWPVATAAEARTVAVKGGKTKTIRMCGDQRRVHVLFPRQRARLTNPARRGRLIIQTCRDGRWVSTQRLPRHRTTIRRPVGDFRVRNDEVHVKSAYLRYGIGELVDAPFTMVVFNSNRSVVPCASDDQPLAVLGHLTAPRVALEGEDRGVTLLLHGLGYGEFFWRFVAVKGYNTARKLALAGHAVVTLDRPYYRGSKPRDDNGNATCIGSQADMTHQIVAALHDGSYNVFGTRRIAFDRVAVVGHSIGGLIAEITAASFDGVDALGVVSYADQAQSPLALAQVGQEIATCLLGGVKDHPGYAPFGVTQDDFRSASLNAPTNPRVAKRVVRRRTRDPCGDVASVASGIVVAQAAVAKITVPVLLLAGESDALFGPAAVALQRAKTPLANVTEREIPDTGHALTLGYSAPDVVKALSDWLHDNRF